MKKIILILALLGFSTTSFAESLLLVFLASSSLASLFFLSRETKFVVSGKYSTANSFWGTSEEGPKNIIQSQKNISNPDEFTTKLTNWRGKKNLDNKYCENNGGTQSRCDVQYNGYRMLGVGLDSDFVETSGKKTKYLFFMSELSPTDLLNTLDFSKAGVLISEIE